MLQLSPNKTSEMHKAVAMHLGVLKGEFEGGVLDENCVENADETHLLSIWIMGEH
jgi:hypothetical protein